MHGNRGAWQTYLMEQETCPQGREFEPYVGCGDYFKFFLNKKKYMWKDFGVHLQDHHCLPMCKALIPSSNQEANALFLVQVLATGPSVDIANWVHRKSGH